MSGTSGLRKHGHASPGDGGPLGGVIAQAQLPPARCVALTNKSGGSLAAGDVVIVDTANNEAVTTTTVAQSTKPIGVVQETIANNATGQVAVEGYVALINTTASVTRGHYAETSTTVKKATANSARREGSFAIYLIGGTTPSGLLFGVPDPAAGGGSLSDQGVITYLDGTVAAAPATPAAGKLRIYAKTGKVLAVKDDAGVETELGAGGGGSALKAARFYLSSPQSVSDNSTFATVVIDSEDWNDGFCTLTSGVISFDEAGTYLIQCWFEFSTFAGCAADSWYEIKFIVNNSDPNDSTSLAERIRDALFSVPIGHADGFDGTHLFEIGDEVSVKIYQITGFANNLNQCVVAVTQLVAA